ncbi:MAG: hypothetical protein JOZ47_10720 [Kutzneria sp.]|nr:hypothetical protein [Kutzneria sp.]MBV9845533.1 hypothetical protein [Kutzneria sp.]
MLRATFCPVSGFLGAGKTTTLLAVATELRRRGKRPAVITNDQGRDLVDTRTAASVLDAVSEVTDGCFCCRFDELAAAVTAFVDAGADTVLAEAVGSCTDLRATVVRPLRAHYGERLRVAPLTAVVDPSRYRLFARAWDVGADSDISYLYAHQLAEADVIAVNKVDTTEPRLLESLLTDIARRYPDATVLPYSARSGEVTALVDTMTLGGDEPDRADGPLDYDRYAAAEAELAWLNRVVTVSSPDSAGFPPARWAVVALTALAETCAAADVMVGHAKLTVEDAAGPAGNAPAKASVTGAGQPPSLDLPGPPEIATGRAVINLRVAWSPEQLDKACTEAAAAADLACGTSSVAEPGQAAFRPSYPRPTHRLTRDF